MPAVKNVIDANKFIKYIMDPFEKYEPWEDPQHKVEQYDNVKALIDEYKNKDSENNMKEKKECREQLKHVLRRGSISVPYTPSKENASPLKRLASLRKN